jgi:hypothetical protein
MVPGKGTKMTDEKKPPQEVAANYTNFVYAP